MCRQRRQPDKRRWQRAIRLSLIRAGGVSAACSGMSSAAIQDVFSVVMHTTVTTVLLLAQAENTLKTEESRKRQFERQQAQVKKLAEEAQRLKAEAEEEEKRRMNEVAEAEKKKQSAHERPS